MRLPPVRTLVASLILAAASSLSLPASAATPSAAPAAAKSHPFRPVCGSAAPETALDLDVVSAVCENCKIRLVEATSPTFANLGAAENEAVALGAKVISNSYGGSDASDASYGSYYNHPGVAITVSSGDSGYGV